MVFLFYFLRYLILTYNYLATVLDSSSGKPAANVEIRLQECQTGVAGGTADLFSPIGHGYVILSSSNMYGLG
jgi:hypothetical protein